jgi:prepilin-type N-terminal cleavage/methylation domain-containing protein
MIRKKLLAQLQMAPLPYSINMKGFTLIEMLLYIAVLSLIITSMYEMWFALEDTTQHYNMRLNYIQENITTLQNFHDSKK